MEEYEGKDGFDRLIELLDQNGMEHSDVYEDTFRSMAFFDRAGSPHECWPAGSHELVNVVVAMTPENAVSFDIDGVFYENAKLRELVRDMWFKIDGATLYYNVSEWKPILSELGIEVPS